ISCLSRAISSLTCNFLRFSSAMWRSSIEGWVSASAISCSSAWCRFSSSARCDSIAMWHASLQMASSDRSYTLTIDPYDTPILPLRESLPPGVAVDLWAIGQNAIIAGHLGPVRCNRLGATRAAMTQEEERELRAELARLQQEHRDLDAAIAALQDSPGSDLIQV